MADKLKGEDGERARVVRTKLGKMAFEKDRSPDVHDRTQPPQDRA
ncbi:hypothetical protein [Hwanghaeella sp. 1Z406]|jgi:hypothetical protein|tara:strand:- start:779 stop:913 length:135 start_codon:yes stop_codon:yes gene_type:complete